jgi:putative tricarboxylic transport membrane protein
MSRAILRDREFLSGLLFMAIGAGALWQGQRIPLGTLTDMGPGYFPVVLGGLLLFFGLIAALSGVFAHARAPISTAPIRPLLAITASIVAFALLLDRIGLIFTVLVCSLLASAARPRVLNPSNLALAVLLAASCTFVFIRLLGVPMRLLPAALQGY